MMFNYTNRGHKLGHGRLQNKQIYPYTSGELEMNVSHNQHQIDVHKCNEVISSSFPFANE